MGGSDGTRAVSEVMGAILVFSLLITALGAYQAVVVPNQNEQVEFRHSQEVQQDFIDLRNSIHRSATDGDDTSTSVDLGVSYPVRSLTLNPPEAGGTLQGTTTSGSTQDLAVENATAINGEIDDYWDNSTREFTTGKVVYAPSYSLYRNAPQTVVENGLIYNKFGGDDPDIPLSGQNVVSGREISLVAIESDLSQSQVETTAIDVNAVSGTPTKIAVTNASNGDNVTIRIPTNLSEEVWVSQLLADQIDGADSDVTTCDDADWSTAGDSQGDRYIHDCTYTDSVSSEFNVLALEMERNETYTLKLSKVSVGKTMAAPGPHYITTGAGGEGSLVDIERRELTFQVRDRFNNPVSGVEVPLEATNGQFEDGSTTKTMTTNEDGEITMTFVPADVPDGGSETATIAAGGTLDLDADPGPDFDPDGDGSEPLEKAEFEFTVVDSEADTDVGGSVNPSGPIVLTDATTSGEQGGAGKSIDCNDGNSNCIVHLQFNHNNPSGEDWKITELRYHFYLAPGAPGSPARDAPPMNVQIWEDSPSCSTETYEFQDNYESAPFGTVSAGGSKNLILNFEDPSSEFSTIQGDGFFITLKFESTTNPSNSFIATYFASPVKDTSIENPCN